MKSTLTIGIILVLLLACTGIASALPLVTNGGFETSSPQFSDTFTTIPGTAFTVPPWNIDAGSIDLINTYWQPHTGSYSIDLAGNAPGTISQTIASEAGQTCDLTFWMAGNPDSGPVTKQVQVSWGGVPKETFSFDTTGNSRASMGWVQKGISGLAASGPTVLEFKDVSGTDFYGAALDDIVVECRGGITPVPEFPTFALPVALIIGLIGAVLFIQRSKE
jgi:choice-of-anchor C domain-containing protein